MARSGACGTKWLGVRGSRWGIGEVWGACVTGSDGLAA
jgi:hypothetical protein